MTNGFFNYSNPLARNTLARAEQVNAGFREVVTGFDKLPAEDELKEGRVTYGTDSGTANAYVVTLPYPPDAYTEGMVVSFKAASTCTGASTVNVYGASGALLGVKAIKRLSGADTVANDIVAGGLTELRYDGTVFRGTLTNGDVIASAASASAAASSASAAAGSASAAAGSASSASSSATAAALSASSSSSSALAAAGSASTANTKAGEAASSASAAASSASTATTKAGEAASSASAAATSASAAETSATTVSDRLVAASNSSVSVGSGTKSFTLTASGKSFAVGQYVIAVKTSDATVYMVGRVTSFSGTSLSISVGTADFSGSGSHSGWTIILSARPTDVSATTVVASAGGTGAGAARTLANWMAGAYTELTDDGPVYYHRTMSGSVTPGATPAGGFKPQAWMFDVDDAVVVSSSGFMNGVSVRHEFGGSSVTGGRHGVYSAVWHNKGATASGNTNRNYVGGGFAAYAVSGDGGSGVTKSTAKGAYFGAGAAAYAEATATNLLSVCGLEVNTFTETGATAFYNPCIAVVPCNAEPGALSSVISLGAQGAVGDFGPHAGCDYGILLTDLHGADPLKTTGSVLGSYWESGSARTVAHGIDLSGFAVSGSLLKGQHASLTESTLTLYGSAAFLVASGSGTHVPTVIKTKGRLDHRFQNGAGALGFQVYADVEPANYLRVYGVPSGSKVGMRGVGSDTNVGVAVETTGTGDVHFVTDAAGGYLVQFEVRHTASANRRPYITGSNGGNPTIGTTAGDLLLTSAGGSICFGTHSAIGSETVTGYITIKDAAGNSRKLAVVS